MLSPGWNQGVDWGCHSHLELGYSSLPVVCRSHLPVIMGPRAFSPYWLSARSCFQLHRLPVFWITCLLHLQASNSVANSFLEPLWLPLTRENSVSYFFKFKFNQPIHSTWVVSDSVFNNSSAEYNTRCSSRHVPFFVSKGLICWGQAHLEKISVP